MSADFLSPSQQLLRQARQQPDAIAVVRAGTSLTYGQLADLTLRYIDAARELAITPGMLVGIACDNRLIHLLLMLACGHIGAPTISLVRGDLRHASALAVQCGFVFTEMADLPTAASRRHQVITSEWVAAVEAHRAPPDWNALDVPPAADAIARIVRTSGTTGQAKTMALTQRVVHHVVAQYGSDPAEHIPMPPRFLLLYGLTAQFSCNRIAMCIRMGGTAILTNRRDFFSDLERYDANYTMLLVGDAERLVSQLPASFRKPPEFGLASAGAGLSPRLRAVLLEKLCSHVVDIYASNETGRICVTGADGVGRVHSGVQVAIVDEHGREQPRGEPGLIKVKSPSMVDGYIGDPALSAATFIDGWFHTSDVGLMPAPGRLVLTGRADELLNLGGLKVAPGPIEDGLKTIAGVRDAAAVHIATALGGGMLALAIEPEDGSSVEQLKAAVADSVGHKYSHYHLMFVRRLPRTENGKVRRHEVEELFRRGLASRA